VAVVLDSTVIVGFLDHEDALHEAADERVRELLPTEPLLASVISLAELLTGATKGHHSGSDVRGFFDELLSGVLPVDVPVAERAAELRGGRQSLRMPDALILATAELHPEAQLVLAGDAEWRRVRGLACEVELLA
jgi:predicted nucleic acid-binding protein